MRYEPLCWSRRAFLAAGAGVTLARPAQPAEEGRPFAAEPRRPGPYEVLRRFISPGQDGYVYEKEAADFAGQLGKLRESGSMPLAPDFEGVSPAAARWRPVDSEVDVAGFGSSETFAEGLKRWLASLGEIHRLQFIVLAGYRVRFEAAGKADGAYYGRVGHWRMEWRDGKLARFHPLDETRARRKEKRFTDCSEQLLGGSAEWRGQLLRGNPYWRSRLDSAAGIDIYGSQGIAAGDIDGDGWDEIYVCQPGGLPNRLFKRRDDGSFADIAPASGVDLLDDSSCALFVDFRNCGLQDLLLLAPGGPLYFANQGGGKFKLMREAFQFARPPQGTFTGMSAADYDRDGRVDLYLCTYVYFQSEDRYHYPVPYHDAQAGPPNYLLRNRLHADGSGVFEDVTSATGMDHNNNRYSFAAAWQDYDGSGWPSLYVANDFGRNNLYRNAGGRFHDAAKQAGVEDIGPGMSACWFDYDGDLLPDLYVANMWTPDGQRVVADAHFPLNTTAEMRDMYRRHTKGNSLYRNRGDGTFEEIADAGGAEAGGWAWSSEGIDFDNDGTPEVLIAAGMLTNSRPEDAASFFWRQVVAKTPLDASPAPEYENGWNSINQYIREDYSWNGREPNRLYAWKEGQFRDCSGVSGLDFPDDSRTFAATDFDGDGNLDLFLKSRLGPQVRALQNNCGAANHSIALALRGVRSNRDAIGAVVEIEFGARRARKTLQAGSGYLSQHTKVLHFGLGAERKVKAVHVRWPSGAEQSFEDLDAGHRYRIVEDSTGLEKTAFLPRRALRASNVAGDNSAGPAPIWLIEPVPLPEKRSGPGFLLLTDGRDQPPAGVPVQVLNLKQAHPDTAAAYALFRRYLFDRRMALTLPTLFLLDANGHVNKIYPGIPAADVLQADLHAQRGADPGLLALPFPGWYLGRPPRNYYKLGAAFLGAGYLEQGLPYLEAAIKLRPDNFRAWLAMGQVHLEAKRVAEARAALARALELNPHSLEALNSMGGLAIEEGRNDEALRLFEKMLAIAPRSIYGLTNAAMALARLDKKQDAEKLYRRALEIDPKDSETLDRLGQFIGQQGRLAEAIALFKRAIESNPKSGSAVNDLAVAYMQAAQVQDAVAALRYGISVAPDYDILYLNLARVHVGQGDRERAREVLQRLLDRAPNNTLARRALQQLGEP